MSENYVITLDDNMLKALDDALHCQMCKDYYSYCVMAICCHNFCAHCIRKRMKTDQDCPYCFEDIKESDLRNNKVIDKMVRIFKKSRTKKRQKVMEEKQTGTVMIPEVKIEILDEEVTVTANRQDVPMRDSSYEGNGNDANNYTAISSVMPTSQAISISDIDYRAITDTSICTSDNLNISPDLNISNNPSENSGTEAGMVQLYGTRPNDRSTQDVLQRIFICNERINEQIKKLSETQVDIKGELQMISCAFGTSNNSFEVSHLQLQLPFKLPVESDEELVELNAKLLKDNKLQILLARYLQHNIFGSRILLFMGNIVKTVMTKNVATQYSRLGRKGKKCFESLKPLFNTLLTAGSLKFPEIDIERISESFGKALANSSDWRIRHEGQPAAPP